MTGPWLTFEQYQANGGRADRSSFPFLEQLARKKLDCWTMGRIAEPDCDIALCMTLIVDGLAEAREGQAERVTGFSNDGVSVSFGAARRGETEIMSGIYNQIVEILPVELGSVRLET